MQKPRSVFNFGELLPLAAQVASMPQLAAFPARDGTSLFVRHYTAACDTHLILLHGSASHSATLHAFASHLSERGIANVHAPDLRGHGLSPTRRGDIDYENQLEDDLADLIAHVQQTFAPAARIFIGGHSSGGGLALRFGASRHQRLVDGLLLLAPYLGHGAPMVKRNAGGWARPDIPRIILLSALDALGMRQFSGAKVLRFNLPEQFRTGLETIEYSFRLMRGMHPANFRDALRRCRIPMLILVGAPDESFRADEFKSTFRRLNERAEVQVLPDESHLGIIMSARSMAKAADWLAARS